MKQLEWIQNRHRQDIDMTAQVTDTLEVWIGGVGTGLGWCLSAEADGEGIVSGIGEAKDRAETFAREWVARQAAALADGWISCKERMPEKGDGWYHVAVHDYKGRYPRHGIAQFTRDRFWIDGDDGEGDSVFAWRHPALPPLPEVK